MAIINSYLFLQRSAFLKELSMTRKYKSAR
jgi:hypothetical protein